MNTCFAIGAFACFLIAPCGSALPQAQPSIKTVESSQPPYVARTAGNALISITLPPKLLRLDMNAENSIASETGDFKPARYFFPGTAVPKSVLHDVARIYRYDRRRDVPIVSSGGDWVIAEYFMAGSHVPTSRFRLLGKQVQRQEQLDRAGRTIRIIAIGWARPSTADDDETTDMSALGEHPAWIRVFKVSTTGKKTLVALAWRRKVFTVAPATFDEPDDKALIFGLPDGTAKWRIKAEFLKAQDIDLNAKRLSGRSVSAARSPADF
ncbi:hypothetical protein [Paraburkholderia sp. UCT2]|uniref:hypothetical protein n=1 Tax=Paraburkholderia sp. UCT2 TaxID=2615208 RepID=UPI0016563D73|nr:hypothetical protein [Paraburkholderia sp. UCT2]MBC8732863.1 hypothetical protein [Paraburkholderia sp. UCT2]